MVVVGAHEASDGQHGNGHSDQLGGQLHNGYIFYQLCCHQATKLALSVFLRQLYPFQLRFGSLLKKESGI
jgi:hypothetical protein